jgi:hypothetical protein
VKVGKPVRRLRVEPIETPVPGKRTVVEPTKPVSTTPR